MGTIEEIGARLVLIGQKQFMSEAIAAQKSLQDIGKTTVRTNAQIIASNRLVAEKSAEAAALKAASAAKATEAARLLAIGETEAAKAASVEARALRASATATNEQATAARWAARSQREMAVASDTAAAATGKHVGALGALQKIGKVAVLGAAAGSALVGYASVKAAGNFEQAMTMVQTMAGVSSSRIKALSDGLLNMAPGVAAGPTALADALYRIASASAGMGATNAQLLAMTKAAAQLNLIGGGNDTTLGETSRVLGGVRASDIKGAGGYQNIISLAAATVGSGDMKMPDFINALGTGVLPAAKNYGVTLPDVGALLSVLTDNLIPGSTAGNEMAHMFALMGSPSGVGTKAYNAIGLNATDLNYTMRDQGLIPALQQLRDRLAAPQDGSAIGGPAAEMRQLRKFGFTDAQAKSIMTNGADSAQQATILTRAFGGAKQSVPIITALSELPRLEKRQAQIAKQTTPENAALAISTALSTFNNKVRSLDSAIQVFKIRIGDKLIPVLLRAATVTGKVFGWFGKHRTTTLALGAAVGTVLVAAVVLYTAASIAAAAATLGWSWPILAVVAVIALLAAGFTVAWQKSEMFQRLVKGYLAVVGLAVIGLAQIWYKMLLVPIAATLRLLGHVPGFEWAKRAADSIDGLGRSLVGARASMVKFLNEQIHPIEIPVYLKMQTSAQQAYALAAIGMPGLAAAHSGAAQTQRRGAPYKPPPPDTVGVMPWGVVTPHGARAGGGVVHAGMPYWVGERGPEPFIPNVSGTILPAGSDGFAMPTRTPLPGTSSPAGGVRPGVVVEKGAVIVYESGDPARTYEAVKRGLSDAVARS